MSKYMENVSVQLQEVQRIRQASKRRRKVKSRLDRYRVELEFMASQGASAADMALWLKRYKRLNMSRSAIASRLQLWKQQDDYQHGTEEGAFGSV